MPQKPELEEILRLYVAQREDPVGASNVEQELHAKINALFDKASPKLTRDPKVTRIDFIRRIKTWCARELAHRSNHTSI